MIEIWEIILGILITFVILGILPVLLGTLIGPYLHRENAGTLTFTYFLGLMLMLALMQIISVPMTLTKMPFSRLFYLYSAVLFLLGLFAVIIRRRYLGEVWLNAKERISHADKKWAWVILFLIVTVGLLSITTPHIYGDDKTYIAMINDIISSNTLYLTDVETGEAANWILAKYSLSSYWTFLAWIAKATGLHPLILCKTVLVFFFFAMSYAVMGLLASYLFYNSERRMMLFFAFLNLINLFGGFSGYTTSFRLLTWIWQSKAFLAIIVLPFLFYYCNLVFEKKTTVFELFLLFLFIFATCSTTLTGTGLAVGMVLVLALIWAVKQKRPGVFLGAGVACSPAFFFMIAYLKYDAFLNLIHFSSF